MDARVHEARRPEVDEADRADVAAARDEDVLGLEVAVHDAVRVRELERPEQLPRVLLHEVHGRRREVVGLQPVVQVEPVQVEHKHAVPAEVERVAQADEDRRFVGVRRRGRAVLIQILKDVALDRRLLVELLLVLDDLERDRVVRLVVQRLDHLAEAALAEVADDLVAVRNVVAGDGLVVAVLVVVGRHGRELAALVEAAEVHALHQRHAVLVEALQLVDLERRELVAEVVDRIAGAEAEATRSNSVVIRVDVSIIIVVCNDSR